MSDKPTKRKITLPIKKPSVAISEVVEVPPVDSVMAKLVDTLANEINKLRVRSYTAFLDDKQARMLQGYVKSLVELSREQRERDKLEDLSKMTDEELFELAKQIIVKREKASNE